MAAESEHPNHEAILTGVIALANLFSNCVEAFGLIHPHHKWDKTEQLLLVTLGIQQARLLIWGDVVGVSSPPASVTDRAVPKHPSAAYPDLKEPTFFNARDPRLDEMDTRKAIEDALSALVDRSAGHSREEMMAKYGLKPPKKFGTDQFQPTLDTNRLESFRERYELLKEVAETYAQINTRRQSSITASSWSIQDFEKFRSFIKLTQEKVDFLIHLMDVNERVDRAMRMDIKALGWHLSADRARVALDVSKLRLIQEASKDEYPVYVDATKQALDNIDRERRENAADYHPYAAQPLQPPVSAPRIAPPAGRSGRGSIAAQGGATNGETNGAAADKHKRPGIFSSLFRRKSAGHVPQPRSLSVADAAPPKRPGEPERSVSDVGPLRAASEGGQPAVPPPAEPEVSHVRSKSIGDILDAPINTEDEEMIKHRLEKLSTNATPAEVAAVSVDPLERAGTSISAHDQYHGLGRQETRTQW